jgi:hypothetical protein
VTLRRSIVDDYWKAKTADGLWHIDTRDDVSGRTTYCGRFETLVNMPGTAGKEQTLTCLRCIGLWAPISSTERRGSRT